MNVVFLLLSTAVGAGADPAPNQPANPPAAVVPASAPASCDCCGDHAEHHHRSSFFDRFRRSKKSDCCDSCAPAPAPAPCCKPAPQPCCKPATCDSCCDSCGKSSFFDRFRGMFSKKSHDCCDSGCDSCGGCGAVSTAPAPASVPTEQLKKMPKGEGENKKIETAPPAFRPQTKIETEAKNPFELDRRYVKRVARAADYSKLTGQLFFAHTDGGIWVLRYAPLDTEDANGGGVVLARDRSMNGYREGDLVTIEGQILEKKWSIHLGGPLYQIRTMSLVDRPQP